MLHDVGGLLRRAALGQRLAQEGERECGWLFHVEREFERAVLDADGGVREIVVGDVRKDAGFHFVAGFAQLAYLVIDLLHLVVKMHPALDALF